MATLMVKHWDEYQHYKNRNPPWIKLHKGLLNNYDFFCLPVASRALAPCIWLLASECDNGGLKFEVDVIAFRLHQSNVDIARAIIPLIDKGFLLVLGDDASEVLARCKQSACLEIETETEKDLVQKTVPLSGSENPDDSQLEKAKQKAEKKNKIEAERKALAIRTIEFLNKKTGRNYQPGKANLDMILARIHEGATERQLFQVIAKKNREWSTKEGMAEYLRPATLFNRSKFAQYVGELIPEPEPVENEHDKNL